MAQFEQWFDQDFTEKIEIRHCESVMFTGDDNGVVVGVLLFNGGAAYSGGGTVSGAVKRSDGGLVALTGTLSGNAASVVIPAAALACPGPIGVRVILTQGGSVTTVLKVIYSVDDNTGAAVDPGTIIPSVNDLITAIPTAVASIPSDYSALLHTLAPDFSDTTAYSAGSYVWYNGTLYRFTTAHPAGTWTGKDAVSTSIGTTLQMITQPTQNIWVWGDQYANGSATSITGLNIPAGTYTVSAVVTSSGSNKNSKMVFYGAGGRITEPYVTGDGTRRNMVVELTSDCTSIVIYPGIAYNAGNNVSWVNIQMESGSNATPYTSPITAVDMIARTPSNQIEQFIGTFTGPQAITVSVEPNKVTPNPMIFAFDAKYTKGTTNEYPYFTASITTDRGYTRATSRMKIGEEGVYEYREFRSVPYIWDTRVVKAVVTIPDGCVLTVRNAMIKANYTRLTSAGLQLHAHDGDCNISPTMSISSFKAAVAAGYSSYIVIPKISSDGVWFAYHDDTFDISTTILRNPDGTVISADDPVASQYNGKTFDQIPWTYLSTLIDGNFGAQFADEHLMKLDDFFFLCAKTGIAPMFSMHPRDGIQPPLVSPDVLGSLKAMMKKYNVLGKAIIKMPLVKDSGVLTMSNFRHIFGVFGNDVARYEVDAAVGMDNPASVIQMFDAVSTECTVPKTIEWWIQQHYDDPTLAEQAIAAGYDVSCAITGSHVDPGGYTVSAYTSEDIRTLAGRGVSEFTDIYFASSGLTW